MNFLIDTHVLIWSLISPQKLSKVVKKEFQKNDSEIYVSIVSFWEISLKYSIKKLDLDFIPDKLPDYAEKSGFQILNLEKEVASTFYKLPIFKNKDPFDLILAWQAIKGNFILISKDSGFDVYKSLVLKRLW